MKHQRFLDADAEEQEGQSKPTAHIIVHTPVFTVVESHGDETGDDGPKHADRRDQGGAIASPIFGQSFGDKGDTTSQLT